MGQATGGYGYYHMTGGNLTAWEVEIGNNGYGYYNQSGGTLTANNWLLLARGGVSGATSYGVANITGGQVIFTGLSDFGYGLFSASAVMGASFNVSGSGFVSLGGNNVELGAAARAAI